MNNVSLVGRITADPELRHTQSGIAMTRFTLAVDRRIKSGEEKQADFITIVAWRQQAEFVCKYFSKGRRMAITGSIRTGSYNDKDVEHIDMFYLGDDFNIEFDPQLFFLAGDPNDPEEDTLAWAHSQMAEYARLMCETEPSDALSFVKKWIIFQEELSDLLPLIPVYSNVYFDFYTIDLQFYDILKYITWGDAIVPAIFERKEIKPVEEEEEEPEDLEEGEEIFDD